MITKDEVNWKNPIEAKAYHDEGKRLEAELEIMVNRAIVKTIRELSVEQAERREQERKLREYHRVLYLKER